MTSFASPYPLGFDGAPWLSAFNLSHAQISSAEGIPDGWESYLERPDVLKVRPESHQLPNGWDSIKAAHFAFVAELLALYPADTHLYFLARDSEYLYDVARLVTQGTSDAKRIHLLNISRANMRDKNIKAYLIENGISERELRNGKKVLLIDTGFAGTIPRVIGDNFSEEARAKLKTHLLSSSNPAHPSSRLFLLHLNPNAVDQDPSSMHGSIVTYEHMPRYTDRSTGFTRINGRHHPVSRINTVTDGSVSKELGRQYMEDLHAEWLKPTTKMRFHSERAWLERMKTLLNNASPGAIAELKRELEKTQGTPEGRFLEAFVRDALDAKKNNAIQTNIALQDLGLKATRQTPQEAKKMELIAKFPEWAPILEDPETEVPALFGQGNWQMIGNLIDANVDYEINGILAKMLYDAPASGIKKGLQVLMIEKGDAETLQYLASYIFSESHTAEMKDLLQLIIEKSDGKTLNLLASDTFSRSHTVKMKDLLQLIIEKGDVDTLQVLAKHTFSKSHTAGMKDLLKLVIEKGDAKTLQELAGYTFSERHTAGMTDLLQLVIEKADTATLRFLARYTFSQPHTAGMKDLLRRVIEKADTATLHLLVSDTFSKPHAVEMTDLLQLVIEKGDAATLQYLARYTFSQSHVLSPTHQLMKQSLGIVDSAARKSWLDAELKKMASPLAALDSSAGGRNVQPIGPSLKPGDVVSVNSQLLTVVKAAGEGRRGVVYQMRASSGAFYALKVAKDDSEATLSSLANESIKSLQWRELKIPHAKVLVQGEKFVLKTWIEGTRGDEVIERFAAGDASYKVAAEQVLALVASIRAKGAYVGDFRPANVIWNGKAWIIVDSGSVQMGMTLAEAEAKWSQADARGPKFQRRWKMSPPPVRCVDLFGKAG